MTRSYREPEDYHGPPPPSLATQRERAEASAATATYFEQPHSFLPPTYVAIYSRWTRDQQLYARGFVDGTVLALGGSEPGQQRVAVQSATAWLLSSAGQEVLRSL